MAEQSTFLTKLLLDYKSNPLILKFRQRRFELFSSLLRRLPTPVKILDIGGTQDFWNAMQLTSPDKVSVTLINIFQNRVDHPNFRSVVGDARKMPEFADKEFDVVFSNSVIEHVGTFEDQRKMAQEVKRVGKRYFVQTPNRYFPIEPHFLFPYFQLLPEPAAVKLVQHFNLGWFKKEPDADKALEVVRSVRLLNNKEMHELFSEATFYEEKVGGLIKSIVAHHGF